MNEEQVESRSLIDLARIFQEARKLGIGLVLIGATPLRLTHVATATQRILIWWRINRQSGGLKVS